jgi:hypothetical protein
MSFDQSEKIGKDEMIKKLSIPEQRQLRIARSTLEMPDAIVRALGGMTKVEAKEIIARLGRVKV